MNRQIKLALGALLILNLATVGIAQQTEHSVPSGHGGMNDVNVGPNGGMLQKVGNYQIETLLMAKGIMFAVFNTDGQAIQSKQATGTLTIRVGDSPKTFTYQLQSLKNGNLGAAIDLSKVEGQKLHMDVELTGLASESIVFHTAGVVGETLSDAMLIALQKTCPATGKPLGSMGAPPKIMLGDQPLFVCCAGCTAKVEANADAYLKQYYTAKGKQVRAGVFESTLADAKAIAAQKKCPVMDEPLGGMGTPQKVDVNGKAVYICCAGCAKKLHAEPEKYLAMLAKQGVTPPDFK